MSDTQQIGGLESALLARAEKLAAEYRANGQQLRQQILAETNQRLRIEEEREVLAAKAHAERIYQQRVQAEELNLRGELDRMRWEQVKSVLDGLPARLSALVDETQYFPLLLSWLSEAAQAIERDELIVQVNPHDLPQLRRDWENYARQAAPGKQLQLSTQTIASIGGVLVSSTDGNIRFDNTFEGRMEKLDEMLQRAIADQMLPGKEAQVG
ncbi:MAG: V-type ATP synthase subunit E [Sideroxydans sp.]|nr:V-type ATP synthase subunit E [Sideroxydans sp.]